MNRAVDRRTFVTQSISAGLTAGVFNGGSVQAASARTVGSAVSGDRFDFALLRAAARGLARKPYREPNFELPKSLASLKYDDYRNIRFRPNQAIWRREGLPFQLQFFHLGFYYKTPVRMNMVADGRANQIAFRSDYFDYGTNKIEALPAGLNFAGFRIHCRLKRPDYFDEVAAFLGASYFRAVGRNQVYGLSARGLAIDTAMPGGEEFPRFSEYWIERPEPGATQITVYALLDSPSTTGAFAFVIRPGEATIMDVTSHLYPRRSIKRLGVAPLTSMYLFGENDRAGVDDFRPEVHDSDGVSIWSGSNEWLWRPLVNPKRLRISTHQIAKLRGFGLRQRDRNFAHYQDLETKHERRPSVWVEPIGDWGEGGVQLVEIPTAKEINDNVVAYWTPKTPIGSGGELSFTYRLHWEMAPRREGTLGGVVSTHVGAGSKPGKRRFVIDFAGGELARLALDAKVVPVLSAGRGRIGKPVAQRNPNVKGWRVFFEFTPDGDTPADLRCQLRLGDRGLTEIWSYLWSP